MIQSCVEAKKSRDQSLVRLRSCSSTVDVAQGHGANHDVVGRSRGRPRVGCEVKFGDTVQSQSFIATGFFSQSPMVLKTAVSGL